MNFAHCKNRVPKIGLTSYVFKFWFFSFLSIDKRDTVSSVQQKPKKLRYISLSNYSCKLLINKAKKSFDPLFFSVETESNFL